MPQNIITSSLEIEPNSKIQIFLQINFTFTARCSRITETPVSEKANMSRLRWPRIESRNSSSKITIEDIRSSFSTRLSKEKNANKLISSSTKNLINNGMKICFKPKKKMLKLLVSSKTDIPSRSRAIDKSWVISSHWLSSSALSFWTCSRSKTILPNKRSKYHTLNVWIKFQFLI